MVKADQTAEIRPVKPGVSFGTKTVISKGLAPGETVVTDGIWLLAPGMKVRELPAAGGGQVSGPGTMNLSRIFIERPIMTALVCLAILLFGVVAFRALPVAELPSVDYPTIEVSAYVPGASPETMASTVATPLERQFSTIAGIQSMNSTNSLGSSRRSPCSSTLEPQYRRRRAGYSSRHRARPGAAAHQHAAPAFLPEGQSGRTAGALPGARFRNPAALHGHRLRR